MLDGANMGLSHVGAILELTWAVRVLLGTLWASASVLGASWSHLGASCSILKRLGGVLGPSWAALEPLGASWGGPGGVLGESWGGLDGVLGRFGAPLGTPGPPRGAKAEKYQKDRVDLIQFGAILGPCWGHVGAILGVCWAIVRCHVVRRAKARKTK